MPKKIAVVIGTRPEVIRFAPLIQHLDKSKKVTTDLIHTGQHYSNEMSAIFFKELGIKKPYKNLKIGSMEPATQTGELIIRCTEVFKKLQPDMVCVWGDTNSSLAAAIAANKLKIKLAHIEAGCRSYDYRMAEEYNRIVIDRISDYLFPLSPFDQANLKNEKVHGKIFQLGDPLYDIFKDKISNLKKQNLRDKYNLKDNYAILTLHRAENVDDKNILKRILTNLGELKDFKIVFPIHPRTKKMVENYKLNNLLNKKHIVLTDPLGYLEMLELLVESHFVITDSGGFQKEGFFAKKPVITLRKSTEWMDTVLLGTNILVDPLKEINLQRIAKKIPQLTKTLSTLKQTPYGKGNSSALISSKLSEILTN